MPEYSLSQLCAEVGIASTVNGVRPVRGLNTLEAAGPDELAYAEDPGYLPRVEATVALAVLVPQDFPEVPGKCLLRVVDPRDAFLALAERFAPSPRAWGIHPHASVDPRATLGEGVSVGAGAVVLAGAQLGAGSFIHPGAFVGEGVLVGRDCRIGPNASLLAGVRLGERVIVHAGATIGGEGFGYQWREDHHHKVPQLGSVVIEDDVEVGCNSCIDRATLGITRIGRGAKIDNLVQVGHNCDIGAHVILVSQVGVSGSVTVGPGAMLGGQAGVADHLTIGAAARVGAKAGVTGGIAAGETVWGIPARPIKRTLREQASLARLPELLKAFRQQTRELRALRKRVAELERSGDET